MLYRIFAVLLALVLIPLSAQARSETSNREIESLLTAIAQSKLEFVRNGTAYPAAEAVAHLRMKLDYAGEKVKTAEDFIDGLATKSATSGTPYLIRKPTGETEPASSWLRRALQQFRAKPRPTA